MVKYKGILLDLDDTLVDYDKSTEYAFSKLLKKYKIKQHKFLYDEFKNYEIDYWTRFENDKIFVPLENPNEKIEYLWVNLIKEFFFIDYDKAKKYYKYFENLLGEKVVKTEDYNEVLKILSKYCEIFISTNGSKKQAIKKIDKAGIIHFMTDIFSSDDCGYSKSNVEYYDWIIKELKLYKKEELLIVGDSLKSDVISGANAGIDTCWYNRKQIINDTNINPTYEINSLKQLIHKLY